MFSRNHKLIVVSAVLMLLCCFHPDAAAQRQMPGQMELSFSFNPVMHMGGTAELGLYGFPGRAYLGLNYQENNKGALHYDMVRMNQNGKYIDDALGELGEHDTDMFIYDRMNFNTKDIYASVGYMFRILSTRSRSVTLFLGGSYDAGIRFLAGDRSSIVYKTDFEKEHSESFCYQGYKDDYKYTCFTTGFSPKVELEVFPFKKVSFSAFCRPRIIIVNAYGQWLDFQAGVSANFYLILK